MTFRPYRRGSYLKPHPETTWPDPAALNDIRHCLRYGTPEQRAALIEQHRYLIASALGCYATLVHVPASAQQLPGLRRAIANGEDPR